MVTGAIRPWRHDGRRDGRNPCWKWGRWHELGRCGTRTAPSSPPRAGLASWTACAPCTRCSVPAGGVLRDTIRAWEVDDKHVVDEPYMRPSEAAEKMPQHVLLITICAASEGGRRMGSVMRTLASRSRQAASRSRLSSVIAA